MNNTEAYVKLDKVSKIYKMGEVEIRAVDEISFEISKGEFVVIVRTSGGWQDDCSEYSRRHGYCIEGKGSGRWQKYHRL